MSLVFKAGGIHFALESRDPGKVSGSLVLETGFEEQEGILPGCEAGDDNHSRLCGCASQN